jgi:hypothetical protein
MNDNIKIIDNFLTKEIFQRIKHVCIYSAEFPWYYNESVVYDEKILGNYQFTHIFYEKLIPRSNYFDMLHPVIDKLGVLSLIKIKANLVPRDKSVIEHGYHTDVPSQGDHKTAVLYLNTNDGYTAFRDGSKISSVENRIAIFSADLEHTGTGCTDQNCRVVINFNYH